MIFIVLALGAFIIFWTGYQLGKRSGEIDSVEKILRKMEEDEK